MEIYEFVALLFWILIFLFIHSYLIYPLSIGFASLIKRSKDFYKSEDIKVAILISVYNEEKVISQRIENISKLNYDFNNLQVIVGSDGSTDKTNDILLNLSEKYHWLDIKIFQSRRGKASVLNDLVKDSKYPILVFTDANSIFDKDALNQLLIRYDNPIVGGVCGRLILEEPISGFNKSNREKIYWEYETFLKKYEGELGVLIGANGGIYSIRKNLFKEIPSNKSVTDDLFVTLTVLRQNYKFKYAFNAVAREEVSRELKFEFKRKIRFAATNFQTLILFKDILFNKNILLSYSFWSHKVLRWFMPFVLIAGFILNYLLLERNGIYFNLFAIQVCAYLLSIVGYLFSLFKIRIPFVTLLFFFNLTNLALVIGFFNFISSKQKSFWESTPR